MKTQLKRLTKEKDSNKEDKKKIPNKDIENLEDIDKNKNDEENEYIKVY